MPFIIAFEALKQRILAALEWPTNLESACHDYRLCQCSSFGRNEMTFFEKD
jgi:hypothetical protein